MDDICPVCKSDVIAPMGKQDASILIIGDEPTEQDIVNGYPFSGAYGAILENELRFIGIRIRDVRRMYAWPHKNNKKSECFEEGIKAVLQEAHNRDIIVLTGSSVVKYFTGKLITKVSSLVLQSEYFPGAIVIPFPSISTVFSDVGEFQLAISTLKREVERVYQYER